MKGKRIKPCRYGSDSAFFDATSEILEAIGTEYVINFCHVDQT